VCGRRRRRARARTRTRSTCCDGRVLGAGALVCRWSTSEAVWLEGAVHMSPRMLMQRQYGIACGSAPARSLQAAESIAVDMSDRVT
jgi:hypothetical protein